MMGRLEDSKAFRGVVDKDNLDINALELRAASELVVKKCARLFRSATCRSRCSSARRVLHRRGSRRFYPHVDMFMGGNLVYTIPPTVFGGRPAALPRPRAEAALERRGPPRAPSRS